MKSTEEYLKELVKENCNYHLKQFIRVNTRVDRRRLVHVKTVWKMKAVVLIIFWTASYIIKNDTSNFENKLESFQFEFKSVMVALPSTSQALYPII